MDICKKAEETSALFTNGKFLSRIGVVYAIEIQRVCVGSKITSDGFEFSHGDSVSITIGEFVDTSDNSLFQIASCSGFGDRHGEMVWRLWHFSTGVAVGIYGAKEWNGGASAVESVQPRLSLFAVVGWNLDGVFIVWRERTSEG